jgi:hypothetical protein
MVRISISSFGIRHSLSTPPIVHAVIHLQAGALEPGFLILAIVDMLRFTCLAGAGLVLRRYPAAHKRLLLSATVFACLMQAMVGGRSITFFGRESERVGYQDGE